MKKVISILLTIAMLVLMITMAGCSNQPSGIIGDYKYGDFKKYNSYAKDNGLQGDKIYIKGTVESTNTIEDNVIFTVKSNDDGKWLCMFILVNDEETVRNLIINEEIIVFGDYQGFSDVSKTPSMSVDSIKVDGKEYNWYDIRKKSKDSSNSSENPGSDDYDDYDLDDDPDDDLTLENITYKTVNTKNLYNDSELYDETYIKTTLKVNKVYKQKGKYGYKVYDLGGYDQVKIVVEDYPDNNVKKGDYITFSGYCSEYDGYSTLEINITAYEKNKVDKKLFKTFGGSDHKIKKYGEDMYKVGKDIPAGTYIAYPNNIYSAYYEIDSDSNGDDIIANDNFDGQCYFQVNDGEYLTLKHCEAVAVKDKTKVKYKNGDTLGEGQYLVGDDIPAGEYKLTATNKEYDAYYELNSDPNGLDIISNDNFSNNCYVTVYNGQYLTLHRCELK